MKKTIINPLKKFWYSRMLAQANSVCEDQPPKSEAHFVAFYLLLPFAKANKLSKEEFQTLLYSINRKTTLNYSIFGVFGANDNYSREQQAITLSNIYEQYLIPTKDREEAIRFKHKIAKKYADSLECKCEVVTFDEFNNPALLNRISSLKQTLSSMAILTLMEEENMIIKFSSLN